jgi:hypothetical protein
VGFWSPGTIFINFDFINLVCTSTDQAIKSHDVIIEVTFVIIYSRAKHPSTVLDSVRRPRCSSPALRVRPPLPTLAD